jgi:hypothetical protein
MHQGNLCRKHVVTADETLGPVNGVDQPQVLGPGLLLATFLAKKPMLGEVRQQHSFDDFLRPAVSDRDRRLICLQLNGQVPAVVAQNFLRCGGSSRQGGLEILFHHVHRVFIGSGNAEWDLGGILQRGRR